MHRSLPACAAALLALHGAAFGQATTHPEAAPGPAPAAPAPDRQRDARGFVSGPLRAGWWNDSVFYEVFVRSFKDASAGPLAGDGVGDIPGLIEKLDYLNDGDPATITDLGVTGLWLMPINPSPSYHGYDVTDYSTVNPRYGTLDDFRALTAACHKRGIRVILDLVLNHCSDKHPWFKNAADPASPIHDWFIWSDSNPGWKGPWNQAVWHSRASAGPWYYGIFSSRMPDLNYRTPAVSDAMLSVVDLWIGNRGGLNADGYRLDAVRHLVEDGKVQENTPETHAWLKKLHARVRAANPDAMTIGEVWTDSQTASSYVGDELDMTFGFELARAMVEAARDGKAAPLLAAQERVLRCYPPNQYGRFLTNHDQTRVLTELKGDAGKMRVAAAMLLLGPGVPFLYYGEELGMTGDKPDENLRTPMQWTADTSGFTAGTPWEPVHADAATANVRRLTDDPDSLLSWYRRLIRLRTEHAAVRSGGYEPIESGNPGVYAFLRTGEHPAIVVINLTPRDITEYRLRLADVKELNATRWAARELIHRDQNAVDPSGSKPIDVLRPCETYVLELQPASR